MPQPSMTQSSSPCSDHSWVITISYPARHAPLSPSFWCSRGWLVMIFSPDQVSHMAGCFGLTHICCPLLNHSISLSFSTCKYSGLDSEIPEVIAPRSNMSLALATPIYTSPVTVPQAMQPSPHLGAGVACLNLVFPAFSEDLSKSRTGS